MSARAVVLVLSLTLLASAALAEEEPIRLDPVEVNALYSLVPAKYRETPRPAYPAAAREQGAQGAVLLSVQVLADGRAGEVRVKTSSGSPLLDDAAVTAVRAWVFVAAKRGPQSVESWVEVPVKFSLTSQ